jgi:hypothetical protein
MRRLRPSWRRSAFEQYKQRMTEALQRLSSIQKKKKDALPANLNRLRAERGFRSRRSVR